MKKTRIFAATIIMLAAAIIFFSLKNYHMTIVDAICSEKEISRIEQTKQYDKDLEFHLLYNGYEIPFEIEQEIFYFPISSGFSLFDTKIQLRNETQEIHWIEDDCWNYLSDAVANNHEFMFYITQDDKYTVGKMIFTGLPLMSLNHVEHESGIINCQMDLFNPESTSKEVYKIVRSFVSYEKRGNTSLVFPKSNYNLNLYTDDLEKKNVSLLDLREDDDWKLNALYTDKTRVREAVATTLWNEIAETTESPYDTGSRMEYMELIIDGHYLGIYGLMEQIDYKQLNLNKNRDILYKGVHFISDENISMENLDTRLEYGGQAIKTGKQPLSQELWYPMTEYLSQMYYFDQKSMAGFENEIWAYIKQHFNIDNLLNYELYIQAIYGVDNAYKNQYIAAIMDDQGGYQFWKTPWDLNYCFGDCYSTDSAWLTSFSMDTCSKTMNKHMLSELFLNADVEEFIPLLQEQWEELRNNQLSAEHLAELTEMYSQRLKSSGAYAREQQKWPENMQLDSQEEIVEYFNARMDYLDNYYRSF